jgi:hypothetical protein
MLVGTFENHYFYYNIILLFKDGTKCRQILYVCKINS